VSDIVCAACDEPLPETKAALYERFTRYFYEWKQEQNLDLPEQDE
jgi:hypothetical protein